jgi:hypothetical protein
MIMFWRHKPKMEPEEPKVLRDFEARLPDQPEIEGVFDPRSSTWRFIEGWAKKKLQESREKNDNINRGIEQTAYLRGEIRILKEILSLPKPKSVRGLLEEES